MMNKMITSAIVTAAASLLVACAAQAKPQPLDPNTFVTPTRSVSSYILLDRTGSMSDIWSEALGSVNAYANAVGTAEDGETDDLETKVTLAAFDFHEAFQFDVLRRDIKAQDWQVVRDDEVSPRGMTPLFDAISRTISLAEADNPEKAVIVIMTDGQENASREVTREGARAALDRAEARGWEVVFLGAEFANFDDADGVGVAQTKQMAVSAEALSATQERLARKARDYGKGEADEIIFEAEDREVAGEEEVRDRTGSGRTR